MGRPALEVADIFRARPAGARRSAAIWPGPAQGHVGHHSAARRRWAGMSCAATAAAPTKSPTIPAATGIARSARHGAQRWLDARQADLLPVEYFHVVFTLPAPVADIAYQNKAAIYGLLFDAAAEMLQTMAADPKHLGARIGSTLVLHTWGRPDTPSPRALRRPRRRARARRQDLGGRRAGFFLPVRVLSRLFRRHSWKSCSGCTAAGKLKFFGEPPALADPARSDLARAAAQVRVGGLRQAAVWRPEGGAGLPGALHAPGGDLQQAAARDGERRVTFRWKDYGRGRARAKADDAGAEEFIRRFLLHVLPGASSASGTTGCWPTAAARPTWNSRESCCTSPLHQSPRRRRRSRRACPRSATGLRLPALRSRDAHPADLRARRAHPCPTTLMTASAQHHRRDADKPRAPSAGSPRARGDRAHRQPCHRRQAPPASCRRRSTRHHRRGAPRTARRPNHHSV